MEAGRKLEGGIKVGGNWAASESAPITEGGLDTDRYIPYLDSSASEPRTAPLAFDLW